MRWIVLLTWLALMAPLSAVAGPWPRAAGEGFLSFTTALPLTDRRGPDRLEFHAEYGLRPRLTLVAGGEARGGARRLDLALRWHPPDLPMGLAWGVTLGLRAAPDHAIRQRATLALDIGRGAETPVGNLWVRLGAQALAGRGADGRETDLDLSAQIGLRRGAWIGMLGLTSYRNRWGNQTRLRPAIGYQFTPRLTLTAETVLARGIGAEALRLSVWSRF